MVKTPSANAGGLGLDPRSRKTYAARELSPCAPTPEASWLGVRAPYPTRHTQRRAQARKQRASTVKNRTYTLQRRELDRRAREDTGHRSRHTSLGGLCHQNPASPLFAGLLRSEDACALFHPHGRWVPSYVHNFIENRLS